MSTKTAHIFEKKDRSEDVTTTDVTKFADLHLSDKVLAGLTKAGYLKPSPIQLNAIPTGKCGADMVIQSKSGTGKTLVFGVVMLEAIDLSVNTVQGLILAPTREIAFQNAHVIYTIGSELEGLNVQVFIGGLPLDVDQEKCKACQIAVGTPGRVRQLIEKGSLKTKAIRLFILDECDKLMEESFSEDILWIFSQLPLSKQVMAVSATYPEALANLVSRYMVKPTYVRLGQEKPTLLGVKQFTVRVAHHPLIQQQAKNKFDILIKLLKAIQFDQCMIFTNLQTRAESLAAQLSSNGFAALSISGSQSQTKRLQTLLKLRQYQCKIVVATDLAARGIDAEHIDLVVHTDIPKDAATYLHRVGRAGRFGAAALTCTITSEGNEMTELRSIITRTRASVRVLDVSHLVINERVDEKDVQKPSTLTVASLESLWASLPELEGTGLEGEGITDSLLANIETSLTLHDSTRVLLRPANKQRKKQPQAKILPAKAHVDHHNDLNVHQETAEDSTAEDWWHWYNSWRHHISLNKALIQQQEYLRIMAENST